MVSKSRTQKEGHALLGRDDRMVLFVCWLVILLFSILVAYPILNVISVALSSYRSYQLRPWMFFPTEIDLSAFRMVFSNTMLLKSYGNTIFITVMGTLLTLALTTLTAYPLSKPYLRHRSLYMTLLTFTMMFGGGMIPNFLLIRELGLYNKIWAQILPGILGAYNVILMINFFRGIPDSLLEAARIDGAGEGRSLLLVVLPLSAPILATIALFSAVAYWNSYFSGIVYTRDRTLWPVQLVLREIILANTQAALSAEGNMAEAGQNLPTKMLQYASLLVVMVPIMCVYPFLQKHFVKGVMLGAVKG